MRNLGFSGNPAWDENGMGQERWRPRLDSNQRPQD